MFFYELCPCLEMSSSAFWAACFSIWSGSGLRLGMVPAIDMNDNLIKYVVQEGQISHLGHGRISKTLVSGRGALTGSVISIREVRVGVACAAGAEWPLVWHATVDVQTLIAQGSVDWCLVGRLVNRHYGGGVVWAGSCEGRVV